MRQKTFFSDDEGVRLERHARSGRPFGDERFDERFLEYPERIPGLVRVPGDVVFALGAFLLVWAVARRWRRVQAVAPTGVKG